MSNLIGRKLRSWKSFEQWYCGYYGVDLEAEREGLFDSVRALMEENPDLVRDAA